MADPDPHEQPIRAIRAVRVATDGSAVEPVQESVPVVREAVVTIDVAGLDRYSLLCTPGDLHELTLGFLLSEGIVEGADDIEAIRPCTSDPSLMRVALWGVVPRVGDEGRNMPVVSSCGLCGAVKLEARLAALPSVATTLRVEPALLRAMGRALCERQTLFRQSGGTHAAGIFDRGGELAGFAEDTGRHNALDKAIGGCVLGGVSPQGCGAVLSGRASVELVAKCARVGIEIVSAISAPTSLAVELADRCNITLCAFAREARATVFTHAHRVVEAR
jgi:FdhD protein